ncbi:cytochrome P450 [Sphingomonas bisphenolicum]|uniref:Cytochrome P450 n=1 Tax=Sphingomonas bisphenolicum TaxID=296544 RepID=A0ABM7G379_9SPHN|nr:cytochrome P450 [Sphingomonas bisphenolicum]BBF69801.1 cytochrome P450 [Sphingomonas bisphenolicum]
MSTQIAYATFDHDLFSDESVANAHAFDGQMREAGPAVWVSQYESWFVGQHRAAKKVYGNPKLFSSKANPFNSSASIALPILLGDDPPKHGEARAAITPVFSPAAMMRAKEQFDSVARLMVAEALDEREIDAAKLAGRFILKAFPDLLGLPAEGRDQLITIGQAVLNAFGTGNARTAAAMEKAGPGFGWLQTSCARSSVTPDGMAEQIYMLADQGKVSEEDAALLVQTVLFAGFDTTILALTNFLTLIARNPQHWRALDDPAIRRNAFEEALRMYPPGRYSNRVAAEDCEIEGIAIAKGDQIALGIAAAGRDPRHWERPDEFDPYRKATGHLAFGFGIHTCIGQSLARLEYEALIGALLAQVSEIEAAGEATILMNNVTTGFGYSPIRLKAL